MIQPRADRVLIQRIEEQHSIVLTDAPKGIKGVVLAVGPGKWHPGEWWQFGSGEIVAMGNNEHRTWVELRDWEWIPGYREPLEVKPGMKVLFNSKWNDFSHGENKGTGSDFSGPLERPLSLKADPLLHLVQEADIFAIVPDFNFKAAIVPPALERDYMRTMTTITDA